MNDIAIKSLPVVFNCRLVKSQRYSLIHIMFVTGSATALIGPEAAMACTEAIEAVIVEHYNG